MESEETQDYVRESSSLSREDAEDISLVPSVMSIPRGPMFWCDKRCSDEALRSVVVDDGEEVHIVNLCQQCCNESLTVKGLSPLKNWQWKAVVEKTGHRGRSWRMLGRDQYKQGVWE